MDNQELSIHEDDEDVKDSSSEASYHGDEGSIGAHNEEPIVGAKGNDEFDEFVAAIIKGSNSFSYMQELDNDVGEAVKLCKDFLQLETQPCGMLYSKLKTDTIDNAVLNAAVRTGYLEATKASKSYPYKLVEEALIIINEMEEE
jgi:hypothetical protein